MTVAAEKLMTMVHEMPVMIPRLSEDKARQVLNIFVEVRGTEKGDSENSDAEKRKALARHRRNLLKSRKYVRATGRTHNEIDAEIREMRSDRD